MIEISGKIMHYSNIGWLDNETAIKRKSSPKLLATAPKDQYLDSVLEKTQNVSNISDKKAILCTFIAHKQENRMNNMYILDWHKTLADALSAAHD